MEAKVLQNFEDMQKIGKNNLEVTVQSFGALSKSSQAITTAMVEYSKKSFEDSTKAVERLFGAKTPEQAIAIQTDFAKTAFEGYIAGATKISELYANLAKDAFRPYEPYVTKAVLMK